MTNVVKSTTTIALCRMNLRCVIDFLFTNNSLDCLVLNKCIILEYTLTLHKLSQITTNFKYLIELRKHNIILLYYIF